MSTTASGLIRALEVYELTGKPISSFQTDWAAERSAMVRRGSDCNGTASRSIGGERAREGNACAGWLEETRELDRRAYIGLSFTRSATSETPGRDEECIVSNFAMPRPR